MAVIFRLPQIVQTGLRSLVSTDAVPNLLLTTLALLHAVPLIVQHDWPSTPQRPAYYQTFSPPNLLLTTFALLHAVPLIAQHDTPAAPQRPAAYQIDGPPNTLLVGIPSPPVLPAFIFRKPILMPQQGRATQNPTDLLPNLLETTLKATPILLPFSQTDWPAPIQQLKIAPVFMPARLPAPNQVAAPFRQTEHPTLVTKFALGVDVLPNLLEGTLRTPGAIPFAHIDWPGTPQRPGLPPILLPNRVEGAPGPAPIVTLPFAQSDWPYPINRVSYEQDFETLVYLPPPTPFTPFDGPRTPTRLAALAPVHIPGLLQTTLKPAPAALPFSQSDWPPPRGVASQRPTDLLPNLLETTLRPAPVALPFIQTDWPPPWSVVTQRPTQLLPNLLETTLAPPPAPLPFGQYDWPSVARIVPSLEYPIAANELLLTPAPIIVVPKPPGSNRFVANHLMGRFEGNHIQGRFKKA